MEHKRENRSEKNGETSWCSGGLENTRRNCKRKVVEHKRVSFIQGGKNIWIFRDSHLCDLMGYTKALKLQFDAEVLTHNGG